mgnify:FL=1
MAQNKNFKKFPIRLDRSFSEEVDKCVFYTKSPSKHQYILDAIKEKVERDKAKLKEQQIILR